MSDVTKTEFRLTTSFPIDAHVRMGPTTALEPVARFEQNAWGVVTRFTDTDEVKAAVSALPVVQLVTPATPAPAKLVMPAKPAKAANPATRIEIVEPTKPAPAAPAAPAPKEQATALVITPKPAQPTKQAKRAERAKQAKLSGLVEPITSGHLGPMGAAIKRAFEDRERKLMQAEAA